MRARAAPFSAPEYMHSARRAGSSGSSSPLPPARACAGWSASPTVTVSPSCHFSAIVVTGLSGSASFSGRWHADGAADQGVEGAVRECTVEEDQGLGAEADGVAGLGASGGHGPRDGLGDQFG